MANDQVTQVPVEVLVEPDDSKAQLTQAPVEVLVDQDAAIRLTQASVEVAVEPDDTPARVSQVPVEVAVEPSNSLVRVSQVVVEVVVSSRLELTVEPDTTNVQAVLPGLLFAFATSPATSSVDFVLPVVQYLFSVATAEGSVGAADQSVEFSYGVETAVLDAPSAQEVTLGFTFSVLTAEVSIVGSEVGISIGVPPDPEPEPTPGVGPQIVADRDDEELFGLLTLRVESARARVEGGWIKLRYFKMVPPRLGGLWKPKPREITRNLALDTLTTYTFKVEQTHEHIVYRVTPQPYVNFSVQSVPVYFEERTSALWGDLRRRSYLEEAKDLLSLKPGHSRISPSNRMRVKPPRKA